MALNKAGTNTLSDEAVTSAKIEDGAITSAKISDATTISITKTPITALPPTISSLSTDQIDPDSGATITITGTRFVSIPDVKFVNTTTGARITASAVGFTSSTTITATFPSGQTIGIYKVIVENPNGLSVISSATITYSIAPAWSTAAGSLGSFEEGDSVSASLLAYDDDSTAVSSYSLVSGSLPSGITLSGDSSIGALTGTAPEVNADTQYSFTIRATDNESQTSDRAFTMDITNWGVFNALRYDDGSSDYLNRTPASSGNRRTWTLSTWVKRSTISTSMPILTAGTTNSSGNYGGIYFLSSDELRINDASNLVLDIKTNAKYRDISAWYHIVIALDTTQATSSNRVKFYVNGEQVTSLANTTYPSQNTELSFNSNVAHNIGRDSLDGTPFFDGYMAETVFIDGQQLTPSSFGETDATSGIWVPKKISGLTFGTNGFHLKFANSGALGTDSSGNSNNFTVNNLTSIDQVTDTPQNNFATINPLHFGGSDVGTVTMSQGNTIFSNSGSDTWRSSTIAVSQGKWYAEFKTTGTASAGGVGINNGIQTGYIGSNSYDYIYGFNGIVYNNDANAGGSFTAPSTNDIIGVALDLDNNKIYWSLNGTFMNSGDPTSGATGTGAISISSSNPSGFYHFAVGDAGTGTVTFECNFGNPPFTISSGNADANGYGNFEYSVPSGYYALCTKNLAQYG